MTTTTAPTLSPVEAIVAPALDAYSAELAAHGHVYGELGSTVRSCRCGFVGKAGRNAGRSVGLHIAAAERAASKRYDAAAKVALDRLAGMTPAQRRELVEAASAPAVEVEAAPELVEVEVEPVRYHRAADPAPGVREYLVTRGAVELGTVTNRRGGWWRAITATGDVVGSFHRTRAEAAGKLVDRLDLTAEAAAAGVELDPPAPVKAELAVELDSDRGDDLPGAPVTVGQLVRHGAGTYRVARVWKLTPATATRCGWPAPEAAYKLTVEELDTVPGFRPGRASIAAHDATPVDPPAPEAAIVAGALLTTGVDLIARRRVILDELVRAMRLHPGDRSVELAGLVRYLAKLAEVEEDLVVELVGERYVELVEQ